MQRARFLGYLQRSVGTMHCIRTALAGLLLLLSLVGCKQQPCYWPPQPMKQAATPTFSQLYTQAIVEREAGNYEDMYILLRQALQLHPDMPEALYDMAKLKYTLAETDDSLFNARTIAEGDSLLRRAVELAPDNALYKRDLARYYMRDSKYVEATKLYKELSDSATTTDDLKPLVFLYTQQGAIDKAISTIERIEAIDGEDFSYTLRKTQLYLQQGDTAKAMALIEQRVAADSLDIESKLLQATIITMQGDTLRALAITDSILLRNPGHEIAQGMRLSLAKGGPKSEEFRHLLRHYLLLPATDEEQRIKYFFTFIQSYEGTEEQNKTYAQVMEQLVALPYLDSSVRAEALRQTILMPFSEDEKIAIFKKSVATAQAKSSPRDLYYLIYMLGQQDRVEETLSLAKDGIKFFPSDITLDTLAAQGLYILEREDEAIALINEGVKDIKAPDAEERDNNVISNLLALLGDLYHSQGNNEAAFKTYERALQYNPDNTLCRNNYAYFLALEGLQLDRAEELMREVVEEKENATNATYLDTYAYILYVSGKYEQANIYMQQALTHMSNEGEEEGAQATYYEHAGDIAAALGQAEEAKAYWRKALELSADEEETSRIKGKLK